MEVGDEVLVRGCRWETVGVRDGLREEGGCGVEDGSVQAGVDGVE